MYGELHFSPLCVCLSLFINVYFPSPVLFSHYLLPLNLFTYLKYLLYFFTTYKTFLTNFLLSFGVENSYFLFVIAVASNRYRAPAPPSATYKAYFEEPL